MIIPTLNAASCIGACLHSVRQRPDLVRETIVCDGGSTDDTVDICTSLGARVVVSPPGRGRQLHRAAEAVRGDWLLALHADTRLADDWPSAVSTHIRAHPYDGACFGLRFDCEAWQARVLEALVALRVLVLALPYGDQGLLMPTALYGELGGFADLPLLEDVDMVRRIGRARLRRLDSVAITSPARYLRRGWLRQSTRNSWIMLRYALGADLADLAGAYRR